VCCGGWLRGKGGKAAVFLKSAASHPADFTIRRGRGRKAQSGVGADRVAVGSVVFGAPLNGLVVPHVGAKAGAPQPGKSQPGAAAT
jgi:hypothetical protein